MQACNPCNSSSARCCSGSFQWQAPLCPAGFATVNNFGTLNRYKLDKTKQQCHGCALRETNKKSSESNLSRYMPSMRMPPSRPEPPHETADARPTPHGTTGTFQGRAHRPTSPTLSPLVHGHTLRKENAWCKRQVREWSGRGANLMRVGKRPGGPQFSRTQQGS